MSSRAYWFPILGLLLLGSCATRETGQYAKQSRLGGWAGAEVFMMPEGTFEMETLEVKNGRFRYWFSSDVVVPGGTKYPVEGTYNRTGDEMVLSSGKIFKVREINGKEVLFRPHAVEDWDQRQVIPRHMLLPVKNIDSEPPTSRGFFTKEQFEHSERKLERLLRKNK